MKLKFDFFSSDLSLKIRFYVSLLLLIFPLVLKCFSTSIVLTDYLISIVRIAPYFVMAYYILKLNIKVLLFPFAILLLLSNSIEIACLLIIKKYVNEGIIAEIIFSNQIESAEFTKTFMQNILLAFVPAVLFFIFYSSKFSNKINIKNYLLILIFCIGIIFHYIPFKMSYGAETYGWLQSPPFNLLYRSVKLYDQEIINSKFLDHKKNKKLYASRSENNNDKELYILVVGESDRIKNWSKYGYKRNTNPLLSKEKNIIFFDSMYSVGNSTRVVLPMMLTGTDAKNFDSVFYKKTILSAFKECGFKTFWIACQGIFRENSKFYKEDIDVVYDLFNGKNYDRKIFKYLAKINLDTARKKFIIINLFGNHFSYNDRYPKAFAKFHPDLNDKYKNVSEANKDIFINSYDNSVLYHDSLLSKLIQGLNSSSSKTMLMYCPDHGENLFDGNSQLIAHSSEMPNEYELHVPFFVYMNSKFEKDKEKKFSASLIANSNKKIPNNYIFYSFLQMADIGFPAFDSTKSFVSEKYIPPNKIYVRTPAGKVIKY